MREGRVMGASGVRQERVRRGSERFFVRKVFFSTSVRVFFQDVFFSIFFSTSVRVFFNTRLWQRNRLNVLDKVFLRTGVAKISCEDVKQGFMQHRCCEVPSTHLLVSAFLQQGLPKFYETLRRGLSDFL